jgi:hypothetical protein
VKESKKSESENLSDTVIVDAAKEFDTLPDNSSQQNKTLNFDMIG